MVLVMGMRPASIRERPEPSRGGSLGFAEQTVKDLMCSFRHVISRWNVRVSDGKVP